MGFINGLEGLIIGLAAAAAIAALYFLKLKRRELLVPSTLLWKRSLNDLAVNTPFQKLRSSLLLLLQVLIAAVAAFALARPVMNLRAGQGGDTVLLLDVSSSMNAKESGGTRLDLARKTARGIVQQMEKSDSMMILTFASQCSVLKSFTGSQSDLADALSRVEPGEGPTNLREALAVALDMCQSRRQAGRERQQIVIVSDGGFDSPDDLRRENIPVRFLPVGAAAHNIGITQVDLRKTGSGAAEVFLEIESFSRQPVETSLTLYDRGPDGAGTGLVDTLPVSVPPGGKTAKLFEVPLSDDTLLEFRLGLNDDLAADNAAWLPIRPESEPRVLLVTDGSYFLEKALEPHEAGGNQLTTLPPKNYPPREAFDVTVFDRWAPATLGAGSYLFIGAAPPVEGVVPAGEVQQPVLVDWDHGDPLNRFVSFTGLRIARALKLELPLHGRVLVEGDTCPLVFSITDPDRRIVCIAFELIGADSRLNTDWPFRVSFPVFLSNAVRWLNPERHGAPPEIVRAGSPITFTLPHDAASAQIEDPRHSTFTIAADKEKRIAFGGTSLVGAYRVKIEGTEEGKATACVGVNLLSRQESDIAVRESFDWRGAPITGEDTKAEAPREIWKVFGLLALAFLVAEWYVYHRHGR